MLEVFVATRLVNALNRREHWAVRANRARMQRQAVAWTLYEAVYQKRRRGRINILEALRWPKDAPKRVDFLAHVARKMDSDGLAASLKSCRDGLIDAGLIHDDGPDSGHEFVYSQVVAKPLGVRIRVTRR